MIDDGGWGALEAIEPSLGSEGNDGRKVMSRMDRMKEITRWRNSSKHPGYLVGQQQETDNALQLHARAFEKSPPSIDNLKAWHAGDGS